MIKISFRNFYILEIGVIRVTYEELIQFRERIAAPAMKRLLDNAELSEGMCFIDRMAFSYLDGRSWGVDCTFKASGLVYENGVVKPFECYTEDEEFEEFIQRLEGCSLVSNGDLFVTNEYMELELKTTMRCASVLVPLFQDIAMLDGLERCSDSPEYLKMCYIYQQENGSKAVDELIADAEERTECFSDERVVDFEKDLPL